MKKRIISMLLVIVMVLALVPVQALAEGELKITGTNYMEEGTSVTLTLNGVNATDTITWKSNNEAVATANCVGTALAECTVTGVKEGKTDIVATVNGVEKTYPVAVYRKTTEIPAVTTTDTVVDLNGGTVQLEYTVSKGTESQEVVRWRSSDKKVATVNWKGVLTPVAEGHTNISVFYNGQWSDPVDFEVKDMTEKPVPVNSVKITGGVSSLLRGGSMQLGVEIEPKDATNQTVTWSISPATAGKVTNGLVELSEDGTVDSATVTAECDGKADTFTFAITDPIDVEKVTVSQKDGLTEVPVGGTLKLQATVEPDTATDKTVTWSSSDKSIAKVNKNGLVTGITASEEVIITATCGDKSDSYTLKVTPAAHIVLDSKLPTSILAGDKVALKAELVNAATGEKLDAKISWKLAKETDAYYASVTNGTLNTKSDLLDQFPIDVVATVDSAKYDAEPVTYTVNVIPRASAVTLTVDGKKVNDKESVLNLETAPSVTIKSSISPSKAGQSVTWELTGGAGIYDKTIESDGSLTLTPNTSNRTGVITVKAVADDGTDVSATTTVRFEKQGTGILFGKDEIPLRGGASVNLSTYLDLGENGNSSAVTWKFDNGKTVFKADGKQVATLSKTGKLTTKPVTQLTQLTVIATNTVSGHTATLTVNLYPATKSIKITDADGNAVPKTIAFNKDNLDLNLLATVKPDSAAAADWSLKWSSSDENIIKTVDSENGVFRIKNAGKVRIECKTTDGSNVKGYLYLIITKNSADVKISAPAKTLTAGESMNLKAKVLTANNVKASNQSVIWSIADEFGNETKAATIFPTGRVTAGDVDQSTKVVITATSAQDSSVSSTFELTILPNTRKTLHVKADGELVSGTYTMSLNDSCVLDGVWLKSNKNATETMADGCTFFSSNTKVATVDEELGVLTAVGYGTSTITVRCTDPQTGNVFTTTFTVRVMKTVKDITINAPDDRYLRSGESASLSATVWADHANGTEADNRGVTWEVTEGGKQTDAATISTSGVLYAKNVTSVRTVVVKATSNENPSISAQETFCICPAEEVKAIFKLGGVEYSDILPVDLSKGISTLNVTVRTAFEGSGHVITVVEPAAFTDLTWASDNDKVVKVESGVLMLVGIGKAKLTASFKVNGKSYSASITALVNQTVGKITIEQPGVLASGKSINMGVKVQNANATNKNVLWSVDSTEYATINRYTGKLSAKRGITEQKTVYVTATPVDGSAAVQKSVTIYPLTTKVTIGGGITNTTVVKKQSDAIAPFSATANPSGACQTFKWTSSNKSVAEINPETGVVTVKGVGKTVIKATAVDGSGKYARFTLRITK